jgi:hypothetical protein
MCTALLPVGGYPITVKYIISYYIIYVCSFMKDRLYINQLRSLKERGHHDDAAMPLNHTHTQYLPRGGYKGQL